MLGHIVERALNAVGVTETAVSAWLGRPCNCRERKEKLDRLGWWAAQVVRSSADSFGKLQDALFRGIMGLENSPEKE